MLEGGLSVMLVFQIVAMCLCAVLAVLYLIESFRDDLDVQSSNQADPNATKGHASRPRDASGYRIS